MHTPRYTALFFIIILSVLIAAVLLSIPLFILMHHPSFFQEEFKKYNVHESLQGSSVRTIHASVLLYMNSNDVSAISSSDFFNQRELSHLTDVKKIIQAFFLLLKISLIVLIITIASMLYLFNSRMVRKMLSYGLRNGAACTLIPALIVSLSIFFDFEAAFELMHRIFFDQGTYTFDPTIEKIVVLYPLGLFSDAMLFILLCLFLTSMLAYLASYLLKKQTS